MTSVALLGCGRVGAAVAARLTTAPVPALGDVRLTSVLVRRERRHGRLPLVTDPSHVFRGAPDGLIDALGCVEPARTLVLEALGRGIPVVTANKTLVAEHGDELFEAARRHATPLRCEAAVIAGVPFLGAFASRPFASRATALAGVVNGTSGYILSRLEAGLRFEEALAEAQQRGYAEPDPTRDIDALDAADKLAILVRWFAGLGVAPSQIPTESIRDVTPGDLTRARELGGTIRPVVLARWRESDRVECLAGPGFVAAGTVLGALRGVENGIRLDDACAPRHFTGPGAGPDVTAATIVDDLAEALTDRRVPDLRAPRARIEPLSGCSWFVTFRGAIPPAVELADLLGAHGVVARRWGTRHPDGSDVAQALLTFPCSKADVDHGLRAIATACDARASSWPVVEAPRD